MVAFSPTRRSEILLTLDRSSCLDGKCETMSASELMPRSPSADSIRGPTPGSSVTGRERRSVRVVRAGSLIPPSLKVGNAIGTKAYVGPNDPADLSDELLLDPESFGQLREELGGGDV